jgi:hypothetical protein
MTGRTYTVHSAGKVETLEMSPVMQRIFDEIKAFKAHSDFWCHCDKSETGRMEFRGHSVDVLCRNCGGCLQIG